MTKWFDTADIEECIFPTMKHELAHLEACIWDKYVPENNLKYPYLQTYFEIYIS